MDVNPNIAIRQLAARNKFLILKIFFTQNFQKNNFRQKRIGALWPKTFFVEAFFG